MTNKFRLNKSVHSLYEHPFLTSPRSERPWTHRLVFVGSKLWSSRGQRALGGVFGSWKGPWPWLPGFFRGWKLKGWKFVVEFEGKKSLAGNFHLFFFEQLPWVNVELLRIKICGWLAFQTKMNQDEPLGLDAPTNKGYSSLKGMEYPLNHRLIPNYSSIN